jgi:hypothetical protein
VRNKRASECRPVGMYPEGDLRSPTRLERDSGEAGELLDGPCHAGNRVVQVELNDLLAGAEPDVTDAYGGSEFAVSGYVAATDPQVATKTVAVRGQCETESRL